MWTYSLNVQEWKSTLLGIILGVTSFGVEIHSFRNHIMDHFVLEWKSTLKIVAYTLKRLIQTTTLEWIPLFWEWISTPKWSDP